MKEVVSKIWLIVLVVIIAASPVFSQVKKEDKTPTEIQTPRFPIIYGKSDDGFPKTVRIKGKIVNVSAAGFDCGGLSQAGTIKIKLDNKSDGYKDDHVYVLVWCFVAEKGESLIGREVEWDGIKLEEHLNFRPTSWLTL